MKKEITYSAPMLVAGANGQLRVAFEERSKEWYLAKALAAINGAAGKEWSVRIVHHIVLRSGEAHIDGHVAVLSYCTGIFAFPVHAFSPEESSVLRAQKIYCDMARKFEEVYTTLPDGATTK